MSRKPTILVAIAIGLALLVLMLVTGPTEAQAKVDTRPALPPHVLSETKQVSWCRFRHRDDYQGRAACTTRVVWRGDWRKGKEAVRVGWCEAGLNHTRGVASGATYQGAWQFDASARATYGWGYTLVSQIKATELMNKARGWQPWPECKPLGIRHAERWAGAPQSVRLYG